MLIIYITNHIQSSIKDALLVTHTFQNCIHFLFAAFLNFSSFLCCSSKYCFHCSADPVFPYRIQIRSSLFLQSDGMQFGVARFLA